MEEINKLFAEAEELIAKGKKLLDEAKASDEGLTKEIEAEVKECFNKANELTAKAESENAREELVVMGKKLEKELEKPVNKVPVVAKEEKNRVDDNKKNKEFDNYLRYGKAAMDQKALSSLRDPEGGIFVVEEMRDQMIEQLDDILDIRRLSTVINTKAGYVSFPTFEYTGTINDTAESASISAEDITNAFGKQAFQPHKKSLLFKVPRELVEDAEFDIVGHLVDHFATRFAEELEDDFINGTGVNSSLGLLQANLSANDLTSSATDINTLSILDAPMDLKAQYRRKGAYIMSRDQVKQARRILDGNSRPLWQEQLRAGLPPTLNGFPVVEVERMSAPASDGDCSFIFGDLSKYWIVERQGLQIRRLDELYAENDQIGFMMTMRVDAAPVVQEAFIRYNIN